MPRSDSRSTHHLKSRDLDVPKYTGFNDHKTHFDYILELEKFQIILGYSDMDMLVRVVPMSLYDEAYS